MVDLAKTKTYHGGTEARRKTGRDRVIARDPVIGTKISPRRHGGAEKTKIYRGLTRMNADWKLPKSPELPKSPKLKSKTLTAMPHDNGDRFDFRKLRVSDQYHPC
jgi:hypothetical protein